MGSPVERPVSSRDDPTGRATDVGGVRATVERGKESFVKRTAELLATVTAAGVGALLAAVTVRASVLVVIPVMMGVGLIALVGLRRAD